MASIVSKKVSNRAVDRNRIERQCREAMRVYMSKVTESIALVFTAKAEAREASRSDLRDDIAELMSRAALA